MYYCRDCKNVIDDSDIRYIWEKNEFWGATYNDTIKVCPYCKSNNFRNIDDNPKCSSCQEICIDNYIRTEDDRCYCEECYLKYSIDD